MLKRRLTPFEEYQEKQKNKKLSEFSLIGNTTNPQS